MKLTIKQKLLGLLAVPLLGLSVAGVVATPSYAVTPNANCGSVTNGRKNSADCAQGDNTPGTLFGDGGSDGGIFKTVANVLLFIIGAISVIMIIFGGIKYTISQGDSNSITAAKNTILYAVIGLIVALLGFAIVDFVIGSFTEA